MSDNFLVNLLVGGVTQGIGKTVGSPLDVLRIRLQCQREIFAKGAIAKEYSGAFDCIRRINFEEGKSAFWKGNLANIIKYFPSRILSFPLNDFFSRFKYKRRDVSDWKWIFGNLVVGGLAGGTSLILIYPFDYVRIRLINDVEGQKKQFNGILDVLKKTLKTDGYRGLYRGMPISFAGVFLYRAIYFGVYDTLNKLLLTSQNIYRIYLQFLLGFATTLTAGILVYPIDTIKNRMMMRSCEAVKYKGSIDCASQIIRNEGFTRLYRGVSIQVFASISGSVAMVFYDSMRGSH